MAKGTFDFIKFGTKMSAKQDKLREAFKTVEASLSELKENKEKVAAKTSLEEAYIWASRSVRSEQIDRNASASNRR